MLQNIQDIQPKQRLKKYEAMFLLDNREVRKGWDHAKGIPLSILERHGAKIVSARRWKERKLAYEIKKQKRATFLLVFFEALPEKIAPLNREIQLTEGILRHLILVHDEFPPLAFEPVEEEDVDVSKVPLGDEEEAEKPQAEAGQEGGQTSSREEKQEEKEEGKRKEESSAPSAQGGTSAEGGEASSQGSSSEGGDSAGGDEKNQGSQEG